MKDKLGELEELEACVGQRLRNLPTIEADNDFKDNLRSKLLAEYDKNTRPKRLINLNRILQYGSLAAALAVILAGWLIFFSPDKESDRSTIGPLFMAQAQANSNMLPQITLGSGLDSLRQVEFIMPEAMPDSSAEGYVFKLKHNARTVDQAKALAGRLNLINARVEEDGSDIPENRHIYITGENADLLVWPYQGSWQYSCRQEGAGGDSELLTSAAMEDAALAWLKAAGFLPQEKFTVQQTMLEHGVEIVLRQDAAPNGLPLTGFVPEIRVTVASNGRVTQVSNTWYTEEKSEKVRLMDYDQALEALKRGEGSFEAKNYRHDAPGKATIERVQEAYQLAYAIDFTPYLVPVAVFSGEYKPQGEPADKFSAVIPLLKNNTWPNTGNFVLRTELPVVPTAQSLVLERGQEASKMEIPELAAFFNIKGRPVEDGSIRNAEKEISPTSWDGGWLYRLNGQVQQHDSDRVADAKALEAATCLVKQLPVLPGEPGEPVVRDDGSGFSLVIFPLLYDGVPVVSNNPPGFGSYISVQVGPDGEVWSVNCFRPMKLDAVQKTLLTPEQAWQQLLDNKSRIHVEGFFGSVPGERFVAASSIVNSAKLAYIPRHPELMRNEIYDLVYLFDGVAQVGEQRVHFTAYVDAVK